MTFEGQANFHMETLTFKIADFPDAYHAILGQPCYAKFMAVPNYNYLKLKMPGPHGIITIGGDLQQAHLYERENYDITIAACQPLGAKPKHDFPMWQGSTWRLRSTTLAMACDEGGNDMT
jgi:hypothetical protein